MKLGTVTKQPRERFSYTVNYVDALTPGDNIQTATIEVDSINLVVTNVGVYDPRVKFWVEAGNPGETYKVTINANTADGRAFQDELIFKIKEV